jgi:antitoxin component HigA of HigAB toxin-antitoxin module
MYLIAQNKIAQYIQQHPEAQTAFLTWLKEHPHLEAESIANMLERPPVQQRFTTINGIGRGDYQVESHTSFPLKTTCIVWVGSKTELEAREQARIAKIKAEKPGLTWEVKVKIVEVVLVPPPPMPFDNIASGKTVRQAITKPASVAGPLYVETDNDFKTTAEYEDALARAIIIFEAEPGSPEFDELTKLIPLIAHYEQSKLDFPELKLLDVVKYKMDMLEIEPQSLSGFIGSAEEIDLFLAGKQPLSAEKLDRLCQFLWIKFSI